jgi:triosephosphate isomerase
VTGRRLIGTSWKMNLTSTQARAYLRQLVTIVGDIRDRDVFVLPPFTSLWVAREELSASTVAWGAQDVHEERAGAHTGDISAAMLLDLGCRYVEIGHSERRRWHAETDRRVAAKVRAALDAGLTPILCVGEAARFARPVARSTVVRQLMRSVAGLAADDLERVVVAYEPVWAIGEGSKAAPLEHVAAMHAAIRSCLTHQGVAKPRVIYGGSVDLTNAGSLLNLADVDGLFVGRAALDPIVFGSIAGTPFEGSPT